MTTTERVFVALWPPAHVRAALARVAADLIGRVPRGRLVPEANLHLTLAFIGPLEEGRVAELALLVERCRCDPFCWRIDRLGVFERARVLWAGGEATAPLENLAETVRAVLDGERIVYDRRPFAAHVTVIRNARRLPVDARVVLAPPIEWPCDRATLVRSMSRADGVAYEPLTPV